MGHQIIEAILENGQIKQISKALPRKKIKVHIIYDVEEENNEKELMQLVEETSGIYKGIDVDEESTKIRRGWERRYGR